MGLFVRVVCDQHRRLHRVTDFHKLSGKWEEWRPADAAGKRAARTDPLALGGEPFAPSGDPSEVPLMDDSPIDFVALAHANPSEVRSVFPNRCNRCGANLPRRAAKMGPLLDMLAAAGRKTVTLRELAALAREVAAREARDTP